MAKVKKKLAIIGTGISGLGLASIVADSYDIQVFERESRLGGHSRTIDIDTPSDTGGNKVPVDTGFIVFNKRTYPLLTKLFEHLNVPLVESEMTFGATIKDGWLEYCTDVPWGLVAQKKNLLRPKYWRFIWDIVRFEKRAKPYLNSKSDKTLKEFLDELPCGDWFKKYFVFAMGGAIWSMPTERMKSFPASSFLRFFDNHSLLSVSGQPQWYSVKGGSREYVEKLSQPFSDKISLSRGVVSVERLAEGVRVTDTAGKAEIFDKVAFACHSDQALAMIKEPTLDEFEVLGKLAYGPNTAITHTDTNFMPKRKKAWASWIYQSSTRDERDAKGISLSYWMNSLQKLPTPKDIFVSLNPGRKPDPGKTLDEKDFEHPQFSTEFIQAQTRIPEIQGKDRLWFCGAYCGYGFHEDGLRSAIDLAARLGCRPNWL
ncbi:MAG: NAD(P)/FAD-dependent oxidoreductase [Alphaproteobacteria bacterium]